MFIYLLYKTYINRSTKSIGRSCRKHSELLGVRGWKEVSQDGRRSTGDGAMVEVTHADSLSSGRVKSKVISVEEAAALVGPGSTVMVGGFGLVGSPLTLIEALLSSENATG